MSPPPLPLSVIIPVLNEAGALPWLLQDLAKQKDIVFETIVVDGGSTDETISRCKNFAAREKIRLRITSSPPGRAKQMNHGAAHSRGADMLFLHADTRIYAARLLHDAQQFMNDARHRAQHHRTAGHFPLRFLASANTGHHYYFYESKTHLNRPDCINGDQGFWLARDYFKQLGGFDEALPFMEDARLAARIFDTGQWITLPGLIETSARRFETEGFARRQILNALLCNFNAMGAEDFLRAAPGIYRAQDKTTPLQLRPFLTLAHQHMKGDSLKTAMRRWQQTGAYVADNAWQLAFALDCRRKQLQGLAPDANHATRLAFYDKYLAHHTKRPAVHALAGLFTLVWFYSLFLQK
jgi:rSAM/selenodomain-associated transferase 2